MRSKSGLIIGKFYPPHAGHHYLIDTAAQNSDEVLVVVLGRDDETLSVVDRVSWLNWEHAHLGNVEVVGVMDNVAIDYDDPEIWEQHMRIFERAAKENARVAIDTVYSSEEYGDELAERLGIVHVMIDEKREVVPMSATLVRSDPVGYANVLSPHTRAGLAKRVVIVGAESTGTTTLAKKLAEVFSEEERTKDTKWVGEYGHEYCEKKLRAERGMARWRGEEAGMEDLVWEDWEFEKIAKEQNRREDEAALDTGLLLICGTDAWATGIWQERYTGHITDAVAAQARDDRALYIITDHEGVPFVQDGTRDGEHLREAMTAVFYQRVKAAGVKYLVVGGDLEARVAAAKARIEEELANGWW